MCANWYANMNALKRTFNQTSIFTPAMLSPAALQSSLTRSYTSLFQGFVNGLSDQMALLAMYKNMERPLTAVGYVPRVQTDVVETLNPKVNDVAGVNACLGSLDYLFVDAGLTTYTPNASTLASAPTGSQTVWTNKSNAGPSSSARRVVQISRRLFAWILHVLSAVCRCLTDRACAVCVCVCSGVGIHVLCA